MTWDDDQLRAHVGRVEQLLDELGSLADEPAGELAGETVRALVDLYGEALARVVAHAEATGTVSELVHDELLAHLLLVHDLHPDDVAARVRRALDEVRRHPRARGTEIELVALDPGVARVRLTTPGCATTGESVVGLVENAISGAAPEIDRVEVAPPPREPVLVPVDQLLRPERGV